MKLISCILLMALSYNTFAQEDEGLYLKEMKKQYKFADSRVFTNADNTQSLVGTDLVNFKILSVEDKATTVNYSECNYNSRNYDKNKFTPTTDYNCLHITDELCQFLIPANSNGPLDNIEENLGKIESCKNIASDISKELSKFSASDSSKKYLEKVKNNNDLISRYRKNSGVIDDPKSWRDRANNLSKTANNWFDDSRSNYNNALDAAKFKDESKSLNNTITTLHNLKKAKELCYQYGFRKRDNILALRGIEAGGRPTGTGKFNNK